MADRNKNKNFKNKKFINYANLKALYNSKSDNKKKIKKDSYRIIKKIGEGSYGIVYLIFSEKLSMQCVLKKIDLKGLSKQEIKDSYNEVNLLKKLDHPNIIKFIQIIDKSKRYIEIITEFAEKGDLYDQINIQKKKNTHFPEKIIIDWLIQTCQALKYIHSKHIIHRDIKPQNIFLTKKGSIKLGDFGISKTLNNTLEKAKTFVGTAYYLPPELIEGNKYSYMADIWSLGVTFYQLMTFKMPFDGESLPAIIKKISMGDGYEKISNKNYSEELINLVYKMLNTKPSQRPKPSDILNMDFIIKRIGEYLKENQFDDFLSKTIIKKYQDNYKSYINNDNNEINNNKDEKTDIISFKNKIKFNNIIELNKSINSNKTNEQNNDKNKENKKIYLSKILLKNESNISNLNINNSIYDSNEKEKEKNEKNPKRSSYDIPKIKIKLISLEKQSNSELKENNINSKIEEKNENENIKKENENNNNEKNFDNTFKTGKALYNEEDNEKYGFETKFIKKNEICYDNGDKEINLENMDEELFLKTKKIDENRQNLKDEYDHQRNMNLMKSIIMGKSDNEIENENKLINHNESGIEEEENDDENDTNQGI